MNPRRHSSSTSFRSLTAAVSDAYRALTNDEVFEMATVRQFDVRKVNLEPAVPVDRVLDDGLPFHARRQPFLFTASTLLRYRACQWPLDWRQQTCLQALL